MDRFHRFRGKIGTVYLAPPADTLTGQQVRRVTARILDTTGTHVTLEGHADVAYNTHCARCDRPIEHPVSIHVGFGPVCCEKLGVPRPTLNQLEQHDQERLHALREDLKRLTAFKATLPASLITHITFEDVTVEGPSGVIELDGPFLRVHHRRNAWLLNDNLHKTNDYPASGRIVRDLLAEHDMLASDDVRDLMQDTSRDSLTTVITREGDAIGVHAPYSELSATKKLSGARWNGTFHEAPAGPALLEEIKDAFGPRALLTDEARELLASHPSPVPSEELRPKVWVEGDLLYATGPYSEMKGVRNVPFATWDPDAKATRLPANPELVRELLAALPDYTRLDDHAERLLGEPAKQVPRLYANVEDEQIVTISRYEDRHALKKLPGATWNAGRKAWLLPANPHTARELSQSLAPVAGDAAFQALVEEADQLDDHLDVKTAEDLPDIPGLTTRAWMHQRQAFHFARDLPGAMLWMHMGTGKSLVTLGLIAEKKPSVTIAFAPKRVLRVWPHEFEKHGIEGFTIVPLDKNGTKANLKVLHDALEHNPERLVVVVNYEAAWRDPLASALLALDPEMIVLDEVHRIKSPTGKASKFASKITSLPSVRFRVGLTGTLMPKDPLDVFAQARAIDPSVFGTNYWSFQNRYAVKNQFKAVVGFRNLDELNERLMRFTFQASKDVLDLPPFMHEAVPVELKKSTRDLCEKLLEDIRVQVADKTITTNIALTKLLRLQQITSGFVQTDDGTIEHVDPGKRNALKDLLEDLGDEPVVVFANFREDLRIIHEVVASLGRTSAELSGSRDELDTWLAGDADVLVAQITSGGTGVDLTRARVCIYYSNTYNNGSYQQSLDRTHRPGQDRSVIYYHLIGSQTVDERIYQALQNKQDIVKTVLNANQQKKLVTA